ncbi:MAG: HAMP domain-containing histidine kinase [Phycisphaerales bacterium]|nr:HAMP domain-containing histidine kinase [Phycisphaerales bacterium]
MRLRRRLTWIVFAVCAVLVLEGLGWVSWQAISARAGAQFQERVRSALWRMDSELTPLIAQESARPYFQYRAFYPAERAYTRMWQEVQPGEVLVPSPLLQGAGPLIKLHFQVGPDGSVSSPQAPTGNERDLAESGYVPGAYIVYADELLDRVTALLVPSRQILRAAGTEAEPGSPDEDSPVSPIEPAAAAPAPSKVGSEYAARQQAAQQALLAPEANQWSRDLRKPEQPTPSSAAGAGKEVLSLEDGEAGKGARLAPIQPAPLDTEQVEVGPFEASWLGPAGDPQLVLRRRVRIGTGVIHQGVWLDWPAIQDRLLTVARDLLPEARVQPVRGAVDQDLWLLASVPVAVDPGPWPMLGSLNLDSTTATLGLTWLAVLGAIVAIGLVLRAAMELSDRRGRFVSAVTHELRTPLTTFCLYTEMLAGGMVKDDAAREQYLATLKDESSHLAGIVENVLDYARLGQGSARSSAEGDGPIDAAELMAQVEAPLRRRTEHGGMLLEFAARGLHGARVAAAVPTVERILVNLVDNACKYAADAEDKRVQVIARLHAGELEVRVRDHGPGVPRSERSRVFSAFHRAARDALGPRAGLGLGLALARGLARELGGDLVLVPQHEPGAEFVLTLPLV